MDYPWNLHRESMHFHRLSIVYPSQTDIGFVTKWHAMEVERFLTRRISIVFRRTYFWFLLKQLRNDQSLSKTSIANKKAQIRNHTLFEYEASSHKKLGGSPAIGTIFLSRGLGVCRATAQQKLTLGLCVSICVRFD